MPVPDRRPFLFACLVALVSLGLLLAAARFGWLGPDVGRGGGFCEASREGWIKQPANTVSNLGFVLAGLAITWRAGDPSRLGRTMGRAPGLATAFGIVVVLLGPASMAMHATETALGGHLDMTSMYLVAAFAAAYAAYRLFRLTLGLGAALFAALVLGCEVVGETFGAVPVFMHAGNVAFAVLLVAAVAMEVALRVGGRAVTDLRFGGAALGAMLGAFAIWNVSKDAGPLCDPTSWLQGHGIWHLLGAVAAYSLFRLYASETAPSQ